MGIELWVVFFLPAFSFFRGLLREPGQNVMAWDIHDVHF